MKYRVLFPCVIEGKAHIDGLVEIDVKDWYILKLIAMKMIEPVAHESEPMQADKIKRRRR